MIDQNIIASFHHLPEDFILGKIPADHLPQHIMGRGQVHNASMIPYQTVAVAGAHVELICLIRQFIGLGL